MGVTPLGGIPMVTRSGDMDPSAVTFMMKKENLSAEQVENILNKQSGLHGICDLVPDFREIENAANDGNEKAAIAVKHMNYAIAAYVAKCAVAMGGMDYIVFTGGIGENQIRIREGICKNLEFMGVKIDTDRNNVRGEEVEISTEDSKVKIYLIPTNEELMIARETKALVE